jgi:4'-phosphopantetheinyl transferase
MAESASWPASDEVRVYVADATSFSRDASTRRRFIAWLQPAERARYDGYHADIDRFMFLIGRAMARTLVGRALGVEPVRWPWREGPHGRPEIDLPDTNVRFNVAHSAGLVACALARGRDVGVDVETLDRSPIDPRLIHRCSSPSETADIEARPIEARRARFLQYWTLKEAYLKARGLGISVHLGDISFSLDGAAPRVALSGSLAGSDTRWAFHLAQPTDRHLLAVAASTSDGVHPAVGVEAWRV